MKSIRLVLVMMFIIFFVTFLFIDNVVSLFIYMLDSRLAISQIDAVPAIVFRLSRAIYVAGLFLLSCGLIYVANCIKERQKVPIKSSYVFFSAVIFMLCIPLSIYTTYNDLMYIVSTFSNKKDFIVSRNSLISSFLNNYLRNTAIIMIISIIIIFTLQKRRAYKES